MQILLRTRAGEWIHAVLLARDHAALRLAIAGRSDAVEVRRQGGVWLTEDEQEVEIEAIAALPGVDYALCYEMPMALTATQSF